MLNKGRIFQIVAIVLLVFTVTLPEQSQGQVQTSLFLLGNTVDKSSPEEKKFIQKLSDVSHPFSFV